MALSRPFPQGGRVIVRTGTTAKRLVMERGRCVGAETDGGEERGDATVLAAGSWSSLLPGVPPEMPEVRPARGQMILLEEQPPSLQTILFGPGAYVVPRGDGRVLCGSTFELVGYRRGVTAGGSTRSSPERSRSSLPSPPPRSRQRGAASARSSVSTRRSWGVAAPRTVPRDRPQPKRDPPREGDGGGRDPGDLL